MDLYETRIGRLELFADGEVLEKINGGAALKMHPPVLKEITLSAGEKPWEWQFGYPSVIPDGKDGYFLYYRGMGTSRDTSSDTYEQSVVCICHSPDGINFTRMNIGIFPFESSYENNIVYPGDDTGIAHNFMPFYDTNPNCLTAERFKAVGGLYEKGLFALASEDGIHWRLLSDTPIFTQGIFDSANVAFYDSVLGKYRMYSRYWTNGFFAGFRAVQSCVSDDFRRWSNPVPNDYGEEVTEHFYTNAAHPCPEAEYILLSFPKRFNESRKRILNHEHEGISDTVFMTSRDGVKWTRLFKEAWLRPGLDDANWTDRNMMIGPSTAMTPDGNFALYFTEHNWAEDNRIRRAVIRKHGFVSLSAGWEPGFGVTKPFIYEGGNLRLNYSTSAAGHVKAWLIDADAGITFNVPENAAELYGDSLDEIYPMETEQELIGKPVRLYFQLKDADLYTYKFIK